MDIKDLMERKNPLPDKMINFSTPTGTINPLFRDELERSYQPKILMERTHGYDHTRIKDKI